MAITREQYSRKATRDARGAMALALARHLAGLKFFNPAMFQFVRVFAEWPSQLDRYIPPSAVVLPSAWKYADWAFTPHLLEDTWENPGEAGFGLYKLSEIEVELEVSVRTNHVSEREAVILGVEESFVDPELLMSEKYGGRYGLLLDLPEYYNLTARFALQSARVIDDEDRAMREQRDAVFVISAQAPQVRVGPVNPLRLTVRVDYC